MSDTDREIIQRVLDGDVRSFGILVDKHKSKAMTLAMRILKNREDAEEALQDAFVRVCIGHYLHLNGNRISLRGSIG